MNSSMAGTDVSTATTTATAILKDSLGENAAKWNSTDLNHAMDWMVFWEEVYL